MKKTDLTIIFSSISPDKWLSLYIQIKNSIGKYSFDIIAVGPHFPGKEFDQITNFRFLRDFGSPARCLQVGSLISDSEYISWIPDDAIVVGDKSYEKCLDLIKTKPPIDGMTILYSEGMNFSGSQHLDYNYWTARTHGDLRVKQVKDGWRIAPIFLYNLENFRKFGGLNCSYEHINLNCHDLGFRIQKEGGIIHPSPERVFASNWHPWDNNNKSPIQLAYELNDAPLFKRTYDSDEEIPSYIDYNNWRNADLFWKRRWK